LITYAEIQGKLKQLDTEMQISNIKQKARHNEREKQGKKRTDPCTSTR
jgi:hypothetical protein